MSSSTGSTLLTTSKLSASQKGFAPILIVLLIAAVAGIGGYFIYTNNKSDVSDRTNNRTKTTPLQTIQTTLQPSITPDPTTNWKTYRNEKYGFGIKYPSEFTFSSEGPNSAQQAIDKGEKISGTVQPSYDTIIFSDNFDELGRIAIFHKYERDLIKENYQDNGYLYLYGPCDVRWGFEPEVINLTSVNNAKILIAQGKYGKGVSLNCYYSKNLEGKLIVISNKGYKSDIFNQILSTFKFID